MCTYLEAEILAQALTGDTTAVTAAVNTMTLPERRAFREALALAVTGAGHDCAACGRVIPADERYVARALAGGRYEHFHEGCEPDPLAGAK
jgi:hypothetical protein